jgi:hypothetical protein
MKLWFQVRWRLVRLRGGSKKGSSLESVAGVEAVKISRQKFRQTSHQPSNRALPECEEFLTNILRFSRWRILNKQKGDRMNWDELVQDWVHWRMLIYALQYRLTVCNSGTRISSIWHITRTVTDTGHLL